MRLLVVEDSERLGQLVVAGLSKAGYGVQVHHPQTMYASGAYVGSYDPS
jgi:DNA-binding response OmpR family regulator